MKQVYQSKDGKVFDTEQECLKHEQKTDIETKFENWYMGGYSSNELIVTIQNSNSDDYTTEKVMSYEMFYWLNKHKSFILDLFKEEKNNGNNNKNNL